MRLFGVLVAALLASIAAGAAPGDQPQLPSRKSSSSSPSPSPAAAAAAAAPIDGKALTKEKLLALPDGAVVQIKGKRFTASELRALAARSAAKRRSTDALKQKAKGDVSAAQAAFRAQEKARINRSNAQVASQFGGAHRVAVKLDPKQAVEAMMPPEITSITGNAEPGGALYIQGKHFGPGTSGGYVSIQGLPIGERLLGWDPTYLFPWQPTAIAVVVPDITGVVDQTVSVSVLRKDGALSAPYKIPFMAAREVRSAFPNKVVKCGQDATENACLAYDFFEGVHTENTFWEDDAAACDHFEATAKPPWEFEKFQISNESSGGQIGNPGAVRSGDLYKWQVCWTVNGAGPYSGNHATYVGYLMIKGPKGVPSF
jgi:hypothetical protein